MKKPLYNNYRKGQYLGSGNDMAHHEFDAYRVDDEIHLVYEDGNVMTEKIQNITNEPDKYLWTPFVQFAGQ
jgi:hypothetical protein